MVRLIVFAILVIMTGMVGYNSGFNHGWDAAVKFASECRNGK